MSFEIPEHQKATVGINNVANAITVCEQNLNVRKSSNNFHELIVANVEKISVNAT